MDVHPVFTEEITVGLSPLNAVLSVLAFLVMDDLCILTTRFNAEKSITENIFCSVKEGGISLIFDPLGTRFPWPPAYQAPAPLTTSLTPPKPRLRGHWKELPQMALRLSHFRQHPAPCVICPY